MSVEIAEPTYRTATYGEWHRTLAALARSHGQSMSTDEGWMRRCYNDYLTPSEALEAFNNNEITRHD